MPDRCCNCIERPDQRGTLQPIVVAVLPGTHTILGHTEFGIFVRELGLTKADNPDERHEKRLTR